MCPYEVDTFPGFGAFLGGLTSQVQSRAKKGLLDGANGVRQAKLRCLGLVIDHEKVCWNLEGCNPSRPRLATSRKPALCIAG